MLKCVLCKWRCGEVRKRQCQQKSEFEFRWGFWKRKQRYEVFYAIRPDFQEFTKATLGDILSKYEKVTDIWATNLEEVFRIMQGEMWSPRGEANVYIRRLGLTHTSMSVGDLVRDQNGKWFICANEGFKELKVEPL